MPEPQRVRCTTTVGSGRRRDPGRPRRPRCRRSPRCPPPGRGRRRSPGSDRPRRCPGRCCSARTRRRPRGTGSRRRTRSTAAGPSSSQGAMASWTVLASMSHPLPLASTAESALFLPDPPTRRNVFLRRVPESVPSFRSAPSAVMSSKVLSSISTRSVLSPSLEPSWASRHSYFDQLELAEPDVDTLAVLGAVAAGVVDEGVAEHAVAGALAEVDALVADVVHLDAVDHRADRAVEHDALRGVGDGDPLDPPVVAGDVQPVVAARVLRPQDGVPGAAQRDRRRLGARGRRHQPLVGQVLAVGNGEHVARPGRRQCRPKVLDRGDRTGWATQPQPLARVDATEGDVDSARSRRSRRSDDRSSSHATASNDERRRPPPSTSPPAPRRRRYRWPDAPMTSALTTITPCRCLRRRYRRGCGQGSGDRDPGG